MTFQSTPSAWRVTSYADTVSRGRQISIHTLRMEGDVVKGFEGDNLEISIHTLRMEGDESLTWYITLLVVFQSTPSAWRVTVDGDLVTLQHADFNPHPPHGG